MLTAPTMAEQIPQSAYESILGVAQRLASTSSLADVLAMIIDALRDTLKAERASVFQYDADTDEFFATKAHGLPSDLRLRGDAGFIGRAGRSRRIVNVPDAYADPGFNQSVDKSTGFRTRCILTIPLQDHEQQLVGVAQVLNKRADLDGGVFTTVDELIAGHLANQAAVALRRAQLLESERTRRKLEADLELARSIQFAALPECLPTVPGYSVAASTKPAEETGGDSFDVIDLRGLGVERPDGADLLIMMADATGHGVGPAISVTQVVSMIRMAARLGADHERIARQINTQLCSDLPPGRFVTAFIGVLDAARHELRYISAGQAPLIVRRGDGTTEIIKNCSAPPLGIDPDIEFESMDPIRFGPGDGFVLLSDGFYEAMDRKGAHFGAAGVNRSLDAAPGASSEDWLGALSEAVSRFSEGTSQLDDQTGVVIRRCAQE